MNIGQYYTSVLHLEMEYFRKKHVHNLRTFDRFWELLSHEE
jgi:hypothetical protein